MKVGVLASILFLYHFALAQPGILDSMEMRLGSLPDDTSRIHLLSNLSNKFLAYQPPKAKQYAEEALNLSKSLNYMPGEILALNRLGEYEFRQSNYARAVEFTTLSLKLAEQIHDSTAMAKAYRVLGNINTFGLKQYDLALQYQLNALRIYETKNDKLNIASLYGNITWIYAITRQNLEQAHLLADRGVHLADSLNDYQLLSYNYNSKGLIFMQQGKLDSALAYLDKSIRLAKLANDYAVIAYNKSIIGNIYLSQGKFKQAEDIFRVAYLESRQLNLREVLKDSYLGLSKSYEGLKNYPLAYNYQLLYGQLKDSLLNLEATQKALSVRIKYDEEKRESKIAELEQANQQAKNEKFIYTLLYSIAFVFLITVIILVIRNNQQRRWTNQILQEKNIEIAEQNLKLQQANEIKDKLFSIIGHDLRSPLISLKGLLGMVIRNEVSDHEFRHFTPKLNQLVSATHETLENILQWSHSQMNGWSHSPAQVSLYPLVNRCIGLFAELAREKKITLSNEIDNKAFVYADSNQLELIFRNLIQNAIKFTEIGGHVTIETVESNKILEVKVIDTGVGLTADEATRLFQAKPSIASRGTQGERGTGLGLYLCKEMAENNGGRITVTSQQRKGSTFHVFLRTEA